MQNAHNCSWRWVYANDPPRILKKIRYFCISPCCVVFGFFACTKISHNTSTPHDERMNNESVDRSEWSLISLIARENNIRYDVIVAIIHVVHTQHSTAQPSWLSAHTSSITTISFFLFLAKAKETIESNQTNQLGSHAFSHTRKRALHCSIKNQQQQQRRRYLLAREKTTTTTPNGMQMKRKNEAQSV